MALSVAAPRGRLLSSPASLVVARSRQVGRGRNVGRRVVVAVANPDAVGGLSIEVLVARGATVVGAAAIEDGVSRLSEVLAGEADVLVALGADVDARGVLAGYAPAAAHSQEVAAPNLAVATDDLEGFDVCLFPIEQSDIVSIWFTCQGVDGIESELFTYRHIIDASGAHDIAGTALSLSLVHIRGVKLAAVGTQLGSRGVEKLVVGVDLEDLLLDLLGGEVSMQVGRMCGCYCD